MPFWLGVVKLSQVAQRKLFETVLYGSKDKQLTRKEEGANGLAMYSAIICK